MSQDLRGNLISWKFTDPGRGPSDATGKNRMSAFAIIDNNSEPDPLDKLIINAAEKLRSKVILFQ